MKKYLDTFNDKLSDQKPSTIILGTTASIFASFGLYKIFTFPGGLMNLVFNTLSVIPFTRGVVDKQIQSQLKEIIDTIPVLPGEDTEVLPQKGLSKDEILKKMREMKKFEEDHRQKVTLSGTIYIGKEEHTELLMEAYKLFVHSNPLHTFTFPSVRKMEAEVISMAKHMLGGNENTCGAITSGGTESILMAMKAYRQEGKKKGIAHPEVILPITAHAAFWKAADYFGITLRELEVNEKDFKVDPKAVEKLINKNTVAIVGSAPNYSVGSIDPIVELGEIATKYGIGLHVDCCLGGFFLPFAKKDKSNEIPPFDFSVKGVTSISADTHKYGFSTKGTSVILFASKELKQNMYFLATGWTGGIYASPTIAGSRPGGVVASCWASLMHLGEEGFVDINQKMMKEQKIIKKGIEEMKEIELMGDPKGMIIAWRWKDRSKANVIYGCIDSMKKKWEINAVMKPAGVHLCLTQSHIGKGSEFVADLKECVKNISENPEKFKGGAASIYGTAVSISGAVDMFVSEFLHKVTEVKLK